MPAGSELVREIVGDGDAPYPASKDSAPTNNSDEPSGEVSPG